MTRGSNRQAQRPEPARSLYDGDFALWVEQQVELLRSGHTTALDVPNLVEELEGLTKRDERALGAQLKRIMAHMLKQRYQPQRASRTWVDSIENGREEIADILEQSPSLRRTLPRLMTRSYSRAVAQGAAIRGCRQGPFQPSHRFRSRRYSGIASASERDAIPILSWGFQACVRCMPCRSGRAAAGLAVVGRRSAGSRAVRARTTSSIATGIASLGACCAGGR
jgi:Domain of unknown function DUF29